MPRHRSRREVGDGRDAETALLTVDEAAAYLGLSTGTLRNWISMRRISYVKVGRLTRIPRSVLERFVVANTVLAADETQ